MKKINPSDVKYIKLGRKGRWEEDCIENSNTLKLGFDSADHSLCKKGKWQAICDYYNNIEEYSPSKSKVIADQIETFYTSDKTVLWLSFYKRMLWWCFSEPEITRLPDKSKTRPVIGKWKCESIDGKQLRFECLRAKLVNMRLFKGTICNVSESRHAINAINGIEDDTESIPEETSASDKYIEGALRTICFASVGTGRSLRSG
jgi:hypothetical protein